MNALRAPGGACAGPQGVAALASRPTLDAATARIAGGAPIEDALRAAGYRATRAQLLRVSGAAEASQLGALLSQRFCAQIGTAALTELGVHSAGRQTWMLLAAPFAPQVALDAEQLARRMVALVNQARAAARRCGSQDFDAARPVAWNTALAAAAATHADDMARHDYFSHDGRDGSTPAQRVQRSGYRYRRTGENIAAGQLTLEAAMAGWLDSPSHCANIMQPAYTDIGAAFAIDATSRMGVYWVQEFGTPR